MEGFRYLGVTDLLHLMALVIVSLIICLFINKD